MIAVYLRQLQLLVHSRGDAQIERLVLQPVSSEEARVRGRLRFTDGSLLEFREAVIVDAGEIIKLAYTYHYQGADGKRIFRYDNAPHYPDLPGFPEHKHEDDRVLPAPALDLGDVLREIDGYLYPDEEISQRLPT